MRRLAVMLIGVLVLAGCGGGSGDDDARLRVFAPAEIDDLTSDLVDLFNSEDRGWAAEVTDDPGDADALMTVGEDAMKALAEDGVVEPGTWNRITENHKSDIWVAVAADAAEADGGLQWVSFASGSSPWDVFEDHGYEGA